ncbi:hypothetical protein TCAL_09365 [Tigriopus californicus]|uniref:RING-type domain-containing protein n=1 Tax=Tigriopus californicus TaxID=6832 RepID=A0A553PDV8_TIGCA|nr:E3 ubiquitin-protein ligase goliath-like [Tigriopus californicus]TRY75866.1 hypothetical protein TCAL_09365 [Tigriopus californicus]|eukprot:TCALIF_09365-PA protein Name:"Similar to gol Protein goliath (Drosophila melanogaster)" AED:0.05 eAED:0.05 QI:0/-1/0/1/-1/1/1/0/405
MSDLSRNHNNNLNMLTFWRVLVLFGQLRGSWGAHFGPPDLDDRDRILSNGLTASYRMAYLNISYLDSERKLWHTERTETGRYSSAGIREATGVAVEVLSSNPVSGSNPEAFDQSACDPPFQHDKLPPHGDPWIAIVKRGKCTFNKKISNILALGAAGILVYDNEEGGSLQSMKVETFSIPSVFTYHWKGQEILDLMSKIDKVYITLQEGSLCRSSRGNQNSSTIYCTPPLSWDDIAYIFNKQREDNPFLNWNMTLQDNDIFFIEKRTSVLLVSVSFIVLMIISLAWLIFYYIQRFRYIHAKDQLERKLCSQAKRALSIISTSVLKKDDLEMKDFSETCAVCIENYRVADVVRILPCKHQFHKTCIDQWLLEKRTCPMCKMDILKHYGLVDDGNSSDQEDAVISLA